MISISIELSIENDNAIGMYIIYTKINNMLIDSQIILKVEVGLDTSIIVFMNI